MHLITELQTAKQKLIELLREIGEFAVIVRGFNTTFLIINGTSRWKISGG